MDRIYWFLTSILFLTDLSIRIGLSIRVIMRKKEPSVTLAWLVVILLLPFLGAIIYLLFGENRLGERRARRAAADIPLILRWAERLRKRAFSDWDTINPECEPIRRQIDAAIGIPTMPRNALSLLKDNGSFFRQLVRDIDGARHHCFLEIYIFEKGGQVDLVIDALQRAVQRGVTCKLLLDSIGSKNFLGTPVCLDLMARGIEVIECLPAGLVRALFVRVDLRNHRKIVTIDGKIAYTGSQNLVDPRYFKQDEGVGQWVDIMVRIKGPVVEILTASFLYDWALETGLPLEELLTGARVHSLPAMGEIPVQLAPSGPGYAEGTIHNLLLTTIYAARRELILTTPYFVPDNAILVALKSAAQRGVAVTIIVPEKNDSKLVHYASRARYSELINAGVRIVAFTRGLLHAKTITVDDDFCLIGSVNLDMRSFWLNFEMTLFVYNRDFTRRLRALQQEYIEVSIPLDEEVFKKRSFRERFMENMALLLGPLL
jgi:cardiolipin synthase